MSTSLHNPYPRSPNPSTRSYDSSSVSSAASPKLPALLHGQFLANGLTNTRTVGRPGATAAAAAASATPGPQPTGILPPSLPSLHQYNKQHQQQPLPQPYHPYRHHFPHQNDQQNNINNNNHYPQEYHLHLQHTVPPYTSATAGSVMGGDGRGDSLPPPIDSLASTPGQGYMALPSLHHGGGSLMHGGSAGASAHASSVASTPASSSSLPVTQQQQQQQQQQHAQKRAYRQRRKDPSCDACRERKVKCDATETTSCSECSNRQVKCQFTKETNRRMSSIKQMQDLERQLDRLRRENNRLVRLMQEHGGGGGGGGSGGLELGKTSSGEAYGGPTARGYVNDGSGGGGDQLVPADHHGPHPRLRAAHAVGSADHSHQPRRHHQQHPHNDNGLPLLSIPDIGSIPLRRRNRRRALQRLVTTTGTPLVDFSRARANLRTFAKGVWTPPAPFDRTPPSTNAATAPGASATTTLPSKPPSPRHPLPDLPPRRAVDELLRGYYASVHTMLPMIHWPTFQRQVDQLYDAASAANTAAAAAAASTNIPMTDTNEPPTSPPPPPPPPPTSFVALFFAVLAVGSLFCTYFDDPVVCTDNASTPLSPSSVPASSRPIFTSDHLAEAARALLDPWSLTGADGSGNALALDDVRTLLLLAVYLNERNVKAVAWMWLGSAVRVAQTLGLYMEPEAAVAHGGFGALEAEMRRRVWWALYIVDRSLAVELGRPMLIHDDDCDVALPAVFDDHFLVDDHDKDKDGTTTTAIGEHKHEHEHIRRESGSALVSVPPGVEPLTQSMIAVLHVVRAYPALARLLAAASCGPLPSLLPPASSSSMASSPVANATPLLLSSSSSLPSKPSLSLSVPLSSSSSTSPFSSWPTTSVFAGRHVSASPMSSPPSPASTLAVGGGNGGRGDVPMTTPAIVTTAAATDPGANAATTTLIPPNLLATFDQHFVACLDAFPPACNPSLFHGDDRGDEPVLSAHLLGPLVYLLNARLLLHRHNLAPVPSGAPLPPARQLPQQVQGAATPLPSSAPPHLQARFAALEQCTLVAADTAALVRRTSLAALRNGAGATALVTTHFMRCTLFLLLAGHIDAADLLVRALSAVAGVRGRHGSVATPCGRYLALFTSCLAFKRAEYTTYMSRVPVSVSVTTGGPSATQLYDALVRDEELMAYVSADLQAAPESAWVWDGDVPVAPAAPAAATATDLDPGASASTTTLLSRLAARTGLSAVEANDWGGWEQLLSRVRGLAPNNAAPPPVSSSWLSSSWSLSLPASHPVSTSGGPTSPVNHYTHQPPPPLAFQPGQPPPPQQQQQQNEVSALPQQRMLPQQSSYRPLPYEPGDNRTRTADGRTTPSLLRVESPVGSQRSKNQERISIANII